MPTRPFRILLFNVGYCTELDGSFRNYLLRFYRYFHTPRRVLREAVQSLAALMEREEPDLCCFLELHNRERDVPHANDYAYHDVANKYGLRSMLRHLPFFRHNCNGFFARAPIAFRKHYLHRGTKRLVYELKLLRGISLFLVHFSLSERARRAQCAELATLLRRKRKVIVCGDFNTLHGTGALEELLSGCRLRRAGNPVDGATFPARRPRKALDLFLCSPGIDIRRVRVLRSVKLSDHLPVLLEIRV